MRGFLSVPVWLYFSYICDMKITSIMALIPLFTALACTYINNERILSLTREEIMKDPASALETVESIPEEKLISAGQKARYSLLHTMAIDRNAIDTTDLSLLEPAIDYYNSHGTAKDKVYTLYYKGRLLFNSGDYLDSIVSFQNALALSDKLDDPWIKGMICSYLGLTYTEDHLLAESLEYFQIAYDSFLDYGDSVYVDNSLALLANAYHGLRLFDVSDSVATCINKGSRFYSSALMTMASNEMFRVDMNPQKAVSLFEQAREEGAYFFPDEWYQYAYALKLAGEKEKASHMLTQLDLLPENAKVLWWKYKIAAADNNIGEALQLLEKYNDVGGSEITSLLSQSLFKAEKEHFRLSTENEKLKSVSLRQLSLIIGSTLVLILLSVILLFILFKERAEYKNQLIENQYSEARRMLELAFEKESTEHKASDNELKEIRKSYAKLFRQQYSEIGQLYEFREKQSDALERGYLKYAKRVSAIMSEISSDLGAQNQFETRLNRSLDGIMTHLRTDFPDFDEDTFRLLSYVIAGFDSTAIAAILGTNANTVRSRKTRLKRQILETDTPNFSQYEAYII